MLTRYGVARYHAAMYMRLPAGFVPPCLPTKAQEPPSGEAWLHEIKHDGFRIIARWATRTSSTPCATPSCRRIGSRISGRIEPHGCYQRRQSLILALCPAIFDGHVVALDEASFAGLRGTRPHTTAALLRSRRRSSGRPRAAQGRTAARAPRATTPQPRPAA